MDSAELRLVQCFQVVFPDLTHEEILTATTSTAAAWDSVATVTLINVVEEEFGVSIGLEDVEHMVSFDQFLAYLRTTEAGRG